jgi:hypothetical protein
MLKSSEGVFGALVIMQIQLRSSSHGGIWPQDTRTGTGPDSCLLAVPNRLEPDWHKYRFNDPAGLGYAVRRIDSTGTAA